MSILAYAEIVAEKRQKPTNDCCAFAEMLYNRYISYQVNRPIGSVGVIIIFSHRA